MADTGIQSHLSVHCNIYVQNWMYWELVGRTCLRWSCIKHVCNFDSEYRFNHVRFFVGYSDVIVALHIQQPCTANASVICVFIASLWASHCKTNCWLSIDCSSRTKKKERTTKQNIVVISVEYTIVCFFLPKTPPESYWYQHCGQHEFHGICNIFLKYIYATVLTAQ